MAVSKTKPVEALREAYDAGQRDFGENYVQARSGAAERTQPAILTHAFALQELLEKAPQMPRDVRWRFIGHLQSNKAKALCAAVPGLVAVETVDSAKLATLLDAAWAPQAAAQAARRLDVYVQVNTSGEETKYGVEPGDATALARHVAQTCPNLRFSGLMTIGQPDYTSRPENFTALLKCREEVRFSRRLHCTRSCADACAGVQRAGAAAGGGGAVDGHVGRLRGGHRHGQHQRARRLNHLRCAAHFAGALCSRSVLSRRAAQAPATMDKSETSVLAFRTSTSTRLAQQAHLSAPPDRLARFSQR